MTLLLRSVLAALLVFASAASLAASAAVVEAVQMPAWLERGGKRTPVAAGTALFASDELRTGAGARLYVKLAEGSLVKLGENASLRLSGLEPGRGGVFKAALNVAVGAFRFTTDVLGKGRRRDVKITVATVTAGVRGTDLWGRSERDRQIVCLIEGAIEVGAEGEKPMTMNQPRQFYQRDKGKTQPLSVISEERLAELARETEIEPGHGAARRGGRWKVTLARAGSREAVLALHENVRLAGYAAEIHAAGAGEKRVYVVQIGRLPSKAEAEALAARLRGRHGIQKTGISN